MAPGGLRSPWDTTPVQPTDAPYDCGPASTVGPDITITGSLDSGDKHVSEDVKIAVYAQSTAGLHDLTARVVQAADTYRGTGSRAAARCVATLLSTAAAARAITGYMASTDAWTEQNRSLRGFAIAWLKVRDANVTAPTEQRPIFDWMEGLVRMERTYYEHRVCNAERCYIKSHWGIETAMAAAAIGIATQDDGLFHWAVAQYRSAVGEINARGMLHYDSRGRYAFKNNLASAAALVQIAEFAEVNGQPLYGWDNGAIHLLVHTVALGIVSTAPYRAYTKTEQAAPRGVQPWEIAWASVYNRRFPDPVVTSLLQQVGPGGVDMWGGQPWDPDGDPGPAEPQH
jgi:poly(beta-D-mannuronate) lyase